MCGGRLSDRLRMALAGSVLLAVAGCASMDRSLEMSKESVTPITVGQAAPVTADDLAEAMLRAGFEPEQILRDGPALRNALATGGGAQMRTGKRVEAMFAIHGDKLYVTSRTRGTFVQPLYVPPFYIPAVLKKDR